MNTTPSPSETGTLKAYLQLMRPANIITSMADILAGFAVSIGAFIPILFLVPAAFTASDELFPVIGSQLALLLLSTIGLYGGGVVFNDVFDAKLDALERPERPIPSGRASLSGASTLGSILLLIGILAAFLVSSVSGIVAITVAILALVYNKWGKHTLLGPINMGMCRGGNLLLGMSALSGAALAPLLSLMSLMTSTITNYWYISLIPIIYISAITTISRGEVHGGKKSTMYLAFALYGIVIASIAYLIGRSPFPFWYSLPFLLLFAYLIFPPLYKAYQYPQPRHIGLAVKAGVISLIVMDAAIAAAFAGWLYGLIVLALLPLSRFLAKQFAVT
jgi:4-hydroxybenzoate polyprenyltransferase